MRVLEPITIRIHPVGRDWWMTVEGDVYISTVDELDEAFVKLIAVDPVSVIIDLTGVRFMDEAGVRFLLSIVRSYAGRLGLIVGSPAVAQAIDATGARPQLPIIAV